jgi:hypothetical protein
MIKERNNIQFSNEKYIKNIIFKKASVYQKRI